MKKARKEEVKNMTDEQYQKNRMTLRLLVRTREGHLANKIAVGNRIGIKGKDGKELQNVERGDIEFEDRAMFEEIWKQCNASAEYIEKKLPHVLRRFPVYNNWLEGVKGVAANSAAWLIGEIDIRKATTVSKIWQFAGLNPGMIRGKKSVAKSAYKESMGEVLYTLPPLRDGEERYAVLTDTLIRGDRKQKDFLCPYNDRLRMALCGRMATSFIMAQCPHAMNYYYPMKERLKNSDIVTEHRVRGAVQEKAWSEVNDKHRDMAARRYMVKMFLIDLYVAWRTAEGLPVREPYAEEYLGRRHHDESISDARTLE